MQRIDRLLKYLSLFCKQKRQQVKKQEQLKNSFLLGNSIDAFSKILIVHLNRITFRNQ